MRSRTTRKPLTTSISDIFILCITPQATPQNHFNYFDYDGRAFVFRMLPSGEVVANYSPQLEPTSLDQYYNKTCWFCRTVLYSSFTEITCVWERHSRRKT